MQMKINFDYNTWTVTIVNYNNSIQTFVLPWQTFHRWKEQELINMLKFAADMQNVKVTVIG